MRLRDFRLSREYNQKKFSTHKGTQFYRAPEIEKKEDYDPTNCDLWTIGIMMYYFRFKDIPIYSFAQEIIPQKFADTNLNDLVQKLIVLDPEKRINWKSYFDHPFFK